MRTVARTMLWTLLVALCVMARPAVGQQSGAARSAGDTGVQVDKNSVGGVVLNSNGAKPEAGVWVIAETKSLPVLSARSSSPMIRADSLCPICRTEPTSCGCAGMG